MSTKIVLTRKVQILIDSKDSAYIKETYATLHQWQRICCKAANFIFTHCYLQEQVKEIFYLTDGTQAKLANIEKDENGILTTSKMNSTYQVLSRHFKGEMPMSILSCLNSSLVGLFQKERAEYYKGTRSLRNYRRDIPMPVAANDIRHLQQIKTGGNFSFTIFGIPFRTYLGRDFHDKRVLLGKLVSGEVKLCTSNIQLEKGKIYLLVAFEYVQEQHQLSPDVIVEASLSLETPIVATVQKSRYMIGNREEFLHRRLAIQAAITRAKKAASFNHSGHGRKRLVKSLDKYKAVEVNYINHKLHVYSRRLIDICIRHKAATLLLTNHSEAQEEQKEDQFLLRNWSYSNLKEKIAYKARKAGINVIEE
jgi:IS605 OrfB family transposase